MSEKTNEYVAGGVSNFLAKYCRKADSTETSDEAKKLSTLFSSNINKSLKSGNAKNVPLNSKKMKAKRSASESSEIKEEKRSKKKRKEDEINDILKDADLDNGKSEINDKNSTRHPIKYDPEKLGKTVFVGNIPISITKKQLIRLFKSHGHVDIVSVRIRNAVAADPKMSKKGAVIRREFHPDQKTINAYVVFKNEQAANKALDLNSLEVDGFHIRVDLAGNSRKHDNKTSIFVGNLPFDADDEMLRAHFAICGSVKGVRIVRDPSTRIGKGFGFVSFDHADSVSLALQMKSSKFQGRELRLQRCENQPPKIVIKKPKKQKPTSQKQNVEQRTIGQKQSQQRKSRPPTNKRHGNRQIKPKTKKSQKVNVKAKDKRIAKQH